VHLRDVPKGRLHDLESLPGNEFAAQMQGCAMKDLLEVLRTKEDEIVRVKKEVEALRIAIGLLGEEEKSGDKGDYRPLLQMP
jgi:23S rRNA maturation mini-RNase III